MIQVSPKRGARALVTATVITAVAYYGFDVHPLYTYLGIASFQTIYFTGCLTSTKDAQ